MKRYLLVFAKEPLARLEVGDMRPVGDGSPRARLADWARATTHQATYEEIEALI